MNRCSVGVYRVARSVAVTLSPTVTPVWHRAMKNYHTSLQRNHAPTDTFVTVALKLATAGTEPAGTEAITRSTLRAQTSAEAAC